VTAIQQMPVELTYVTISSELPNSVILSQFKAI